MANEKKIRTTERTGKRWKFLQLIAVLLLITSITWTWSALSADPKPAEPPAVPILLGVLGLPLLLFARLGAWWFHG